MCAIITSIKTKCSLYRIIVTLTWKRIYYFTLEIFDGSKTFVSQFSYIYRGSYAEWIHFERFIEIQSHGSIGHFNVAIRCRIIH